MNYDWTKFQCNLFIKVPIEKVFKAWSSEADLTSWFLETVNYIDINDKVISPEQPSMVGDTYEWKWYGWEYAEKGKIIEIEENKLLKFSFSHDKVEVEIKFIDHENEVQVILTQSGIPTDEENMVNVHMGCNLGWSFWLVNLKVWLEHGILLNDKIHREPHTINQ